MPRLAFLGIGLMGYPMAARLCRAGYALTAWNRSPGKAERLREQGASIAHTAAEAVRDADVVISILENGAVTRGVLDSGVMAAMTPGSLWIDMASTQPAEARLNAADFQSRGIDALDAPVSGGTVGAEAGTLAIMAGGADTAFERAKSVLQHLGRPTHVGPAGTGQLCKLANQLIVGVSIGAVAEAMLLVKAGGGNPSQFKAAIAGGFADGKIMQIHGQRMIEGDFAKRAAMTVQLKDLRNVKSEAQTVHATLPISRLVHDLYHAACVDAELAELDHSALFLQIQRMMSH